MRRRLEGAGASGLEPTSDFNGLVQLMVDADVKLLDDELEGRTVRVDR